jgi:hypothetical protein
MRLRVPILTAILLTFFLLPTLGAAWTDGYGTDPYTNDPVSFDQIRNYGTDDWVADQVLAYLLIGSTTDWQWLSDCHAYLLFGTECPADAQLTQRINGTTLTFFAPSADLRIRATGNGTLLNTDIQSAINGSTRAAITALHAGNYPLAATYLGMISTYVGLAIFFPDFVINNLMLDDRAAWVAQDLYAKTGETSINTFFNFTLDPATLTATDPMILAPTLIENTLTDPIDATYTALWMYYATSTIDSSVASYTDWATLQMNTTTYLYYNRFQDLFQAAISAIAESWLWALQSSGVTPPISIPNLNVIFVNMTWQPILICLGGLGAICLIIYEIMRKRIMKNIVQRTYAPLPV